MWIMAMGALSTQQKSELLTSKGLFCCAGATVRTNALRRLFQWSCSGRIEKLPEALENARN
jgi:hypothetical protein